MSRPTRVWTGIAALTLLSVACFSDIAPKIEAQLETRTAQTRLTVFLKANSMMFSRGRVKLLPGSMRTLDSVASFVSELPEVSQLIEGHAYAHDDPAVNQALSEYRAEAVRVHLALRGVSADRIRIAGPGTVRSPDAHDTGQAGRTTYRGASGVAGTVAGRFCDPLGERRRQHFALPGPSCHAVTSSIPS